MRLAPMRAKRDADVVSQVANAVMSYHAPRSRATVSIVGLSVGVGTRADIIASFPSCASTAICHCPHILCALLTIRNAITTHALITHPETPYYLHIATLELLPATLTAIYLHAILI
jgi:hypothetical protein